MAGRAKPRRTNQERSDETRRRLLDATLECLLHSGYAGTTTTLVSKLAGVSRGAQLHHYPKKSELVRAAIEHAFQRRVTEFRAAMARLPAGEKRLSAAIDLLWEAYSDGETFYPCLEFMVAARTDPEIAEELEGLSKRIIDEIDVIFLEYFGQATATSPFGAIAPGFALAVMDGLSIARLGGLDDARVQTVIDALKQLATIVQLEQPGEEEP